MDDFNNFILWVIVIVVVVLIIVIPIMTYTSVDYISGTIVDTKIDRGNTYFVFQSDSGKTEMLENEDAFLFLKFNSGDFLMNLKVGQHYNLKVNWFRVPFLSWYRNILSYEVSPLP